MTKTSAAFSALEGAREAGRELSEQILGTLGDSPDALVVFASPRHDLQELIGAVQAGCNPKRLVGCSSAGEFASDQRGEGAVSALGLCSDEMSFRTCLGTGITNDPVGAAERFGACLNDAPDGRPHRSLLMLTDALAGHTEEFIRALNERTSGGYQIFGGGAGDDDRFQKTFVFQGQAVYSDAAVGLEILSDKPLGIGVRHGWEPVGPPMRATEADGFELVSLNAVPTLEAMEEYAAENGIRFDPASPLPFFLHNVLGMETPSGFKIRVPLGITERGGFILATEIPEGATVRVMGATSASSVEAAAEATEDALHQIGGEKPGAALFFDCVATRLRMGNDFADELVAVRDKLGTDLFVGCNSYGQVARVDGQFSGFHNCTAVVCVIPA